MFDPDKMHLGLYQRPAEAAMAVITKLQNFRSEEQVLGAGLVFVKLCEHFNVRPIAVLEAANKMFRTDSVGSAEMRALAEYIKHEIKR